MGMDLALQRLITGLLGESLHAKHTLIERMVFPDQSIETVYQSVNLGKAFLRGRVFLQTAF